MQNNIYKFKKLELRKKNTKLSFLQEYGVHNKQWESNILY